VSYQENLPMLMNGITRNTMNNAECGTSLRHRRPRLIARQACCITAAVPLPLIKTTGWPPAIDRLEAGSCIQPRPRKRTAWGNRFVSRTKCYRGGSARWSGIFLLTTG